MLDVMTVTRPCTVTVFNVIFPVVSGFVCSHVMTLTQTRTGHRVLPVFIVSPCVVSGHFSGL